MRYKGVIEIVLSLLGIYVALLVLLFIFQRTFIYFPTPDYAHSYKQLTLQHENESLNIIVLNEGNNNAFIYFGGNAEAVFANAQEFSNIFSTTTVYLVNYRGYGASTGSPSEAGLFSDALAVFDAFSAQHEHLAVVGRSLGSGVAMHVAANRPVSHVALITPYDSIAAIANKQFPIFPTAWLLKDTFDSLSLAEKVAAPTLLIAGGRDTIIPLQNSQRLYEAITATGLTKAELVVIDDAEHNDIAQFPAFYQRLSRFLASKQ